MQEDGDKPTHLRERRPGATGGKGLEGEYSIPSPPKLSGREPSARRFCPS